MINDEASVTAQNDQLIVVMGNYWLRQNVGNKKNRHKYTSARMTWPQCYLLMHVKKIEKEETCSMNDLLTPSKFDTVVTAALHCAPMDNDDDEELEHPSAALKINFIRTVTVK